MRFIAAFLSASLVVACGTEPRDTDDDDDGSSGSGAAGSGGSGAGAQGAGGTMSVPGGPEVLSFDVTPRELGPAMSATFTAMVTDPDGLGDIVGGQLEQGEATFGALSQVSMGTYTITLTHEQLVAMMPVVSSPETRSFVVKFTDTTSRVGTRAVDLQLMAECDSECACINGICECSTPGREGVPCAEEDCETICEACF